MQKWQGQKILILGAARQGLATMRYLLQKSASLIISDQKPAAEFKSLMEEFGGKDIRWEFGGHPDAILEGVDLVIISGGVPLTLPIVQDARKRGIRLTNDSQIFMESVSAKVIGITGSAGKTTTTILVGEIAKRAAQPNQKVWIGGNIGNPLIDHLDEIAATDLVVTELSSFQLELMDTSPQIAAILNITPNHLDRHENMEAYIRAKSRILQHQTESDAAILNNDDAATVKLFPMVKSRLFTFGEKACGDHPCTTVTGENLVFQKSHQTIQIMKRKEIILRGEHNLMNALAAGAIGFAAGFPVDAIRNGIQSVGSIPHRLEWVREWRGSDWYNDSIATAPERSMAAIRSFDRPILLLLGGRDKNLPWNDLASLIHLKVEKVILFGEAADLIFSAIRAPRSGDFPRELVKCGKLEEAVRKAAEIAEKGDVVLLSPGGTSFDEFRDFEERGSQFVELVKALPK
jgi:UDP-N-acetylmuramoylalanine--D-glutamate ligase